MGREAVKSPSGQPPPTRTHTPESLRGCADSGDHCCPISEDSSAPLQGRGLCPGLSQATALHAGLGPGLGSPPCLLGVHIEKVLEFPSLGELPRR